MNGFKHRQSYGTVVQSYSKVRDYPFVFKQMAIQYSLLNVWWQTLTMEKYTVH